MTVIDKRSRSRWEVPFGNGTELDWTFLEFDDAAWFNGSAGIGYDFGLDYHEWIETDISFEMAGFTTTARVRIPFEVEDPAMVQRLVLNLRFDDGYAAFIN